MVAYRETFLAFLSVPVSPARLDFACHSEIRHGAYRARTSRGRGSKHTRRVCDNLAEIISPRLVFKQKIIFIRIVVLARCPRKFRRNHSNIIPSTLVSSICKSKGIYFIDFAAQIMNINEKCKCICKLNIIQFKHKKTHARVPRDK